MKNFEFYNPVKIIFGKDEINRLPEIIAPYKKIMFTYGMGSIKKNGIYDQVCNLLKNYDYIEFGGIEPNPAYETLMKAVKIAQDEKVDFLLAVGGGSVLDGTKFIAAAIKFTKADPWEILSKQSEVTDAVKMGSILTLPATGSEMNGTSVISKVSTKDKLAFSSPLVMPVFSILDPQTMLSLPDVQIANGIIDAYVHVLEQYLTYPVDAMVQDKYSESLMQILLEIGPALLKDRENYSLNANFMWTATMALNGLISTGVPTDWSTHLIGHELTALYGIDHGQSLAIIMPGVMEIMQDDKKQKIIQYAKNVLNIASDNEQIIINEAIAKTEEYFRSLNIKTRLSEYNIDKSVITDVPQKLKDKKYIKLGENKNISPEIVSEILKIRM